MPTATRYSLASVVWEGRGWEANAASFSTTADTALLRVQRDAIELNDTKFGCGVGLCGGCTVHHGGDAGRACLRQISDVGNSDPLRLVCAPIGPHFRRQSKSCGMFSSVEKRRSYSSRTLQCRLCSRRNCGLFGLDRKSIGLNIVEANHMPVVEACKVNAVRLVINA
jgi:hypothetical protein